MDGYPAGRELGGCAFRGPGMQWEPQRVHVANAELCKLLEGPGRGSRMERAPAVAALAWRLAAREPRLGSRASGWCAGRALSRAWLAAGDGRTFRTAALLNGKSAGHAGLAAGWLWWNVLVDAGVLHRPRRPGP